MKPGEELALITRLRLPDGEPMSVEASQLRHRLCPGVLVHDYARRSLTRILQGECGIALVRAKQVVRAIPVAQPLAQKLNIGQGDPRRRWLMISAPRLSSCARTYG